jgi:ketosteroid isomerase-like protein
MKDEGRGLLLFILHPSSFIPRAWGEFMADAVAKELLGLNQLLLDAIVTADWDKYQDLCDESLTCFEPEALGQLVQGLDFHQFYFKLGVKGDVAVVSYIRLNQRVTGDGSPVTRPVEETRVWQKQKGRWKHVHFHRSVPAKP